MANLTDLPTAATLQVTPELLEHLSNESQALVQAQSYAIDSPEMAVIVNGQLQDVKRRMKSVEEWDERFAAPIRQLETTRKALFGPAKQALVAAETFLKGLLTGWSEKEMKRVADERRRADEVQRKAREEAEQVAAAARARAESAAAEARRKAEEARRKEEEARAAGNARAAQAAAAARAKAEREEQQRIAEGERKATEAQLAAAAVATPEVQVAQKLDGLSMRKNWGVELAENTTEEQAKEKIVNAIVSGRRDFLALLSLDMKAAGKLAKALEENFNVPGLKARNNPIAASTRK